jgi:hypothetical protein
MSRIHAKAPGAIAAALVLGALVAPAAQAREGLQTRGHTGPPPRAASALAHEGRIVVRTPDNRADRSGPAAMVVRRSADDGVAWDTAAISGAAGAGAGAALAAVALSARRSRLRKRSLAVL